MRDIVALANIQKLYALLETEPDPNKRGVIVIRLAEETEKLEALTRAKQDRAYEGKLRSSVQTHRRLRPIPRTDGNRDG